jgi:GDPmannose 4,6-dehydratase
VSFSVPDYSGQVNGLGTLRLLSAVREVGLAARFYQASTSELYGGFPDTVPQDERTPFAPRSPYATAKLFAYWVTCNYRDAYGMYAVNGVLFNHESPRRGRNFVTKKISQAVARIARGQQDVVRLGNLSVKRDWGYAPEYVEAIWRMLQHREPTDLVIGTGTSYTVRQFAELCFAEVGVELTWSGEGVSEVGTDRASGAARVVVDPAYFRPLEVESLRAEPKKAAAMIGWKATTLAPQLAKLMVRYDLVHDDYGYPDEVTDAMVEARRGKRA